jgi:hypothetical protein
MLDKLNRMVDSDFQGWLNRNLQTIRSLFPETWTHVSNVDFLPIQFRCKVLGLNFRSTEDFALFMAFLEKNKIIHRDGLLIRRSI